MKRIRHEVGKSIHDYRMIEDKDRILVGVSGGSDSLILLEILSQLRLRAPVCFDIVPVYVDPGFDPGFSGRIERFILERFNDFRVEKTDHGIVAHGPSNTENPCFLCSRLRRKRLFEIAKEESCAKIALGHHKDDLIETLFMNMFFSGRLSTMTPSQSFFHGEMTIIRPLSYVEKDDIVRLMKQLDFPKFVNPCPSAGKTKRDVVREFLKVSYQDNRHVKNNIFRAMGNVKIDYLLKQVR